MYCMQRPGADDVLVLRQELVKTQTLMDLLTQDREKEKEHLEKELAELREKYRLYVSRFNLLFLVCIMASLRS